MYLTEEQVDELVMNSFVKGIIAERLCLVSKELGVSDWHYQTVEDMFLFLGNFEEWACKMTGQW